MAYRRCLSTRTSIIARRYHPSFSYVPQDHEHKHNSPNENLSQQNGDKFLLLRSYGSNFNGSAGFGAVFEHRRCPQFSPPSGIGSSFCRHMSTIGEGSEKMEIMTDNVSGVLTDTSVQVIASHAPAVNEVSVAAADSFLPVQFLQHFIDLVHSTTGFNWWASIVVATLIIRGATVPLLVNQLKASLRLSMIRPIVEKIKREMKDTGRAPMVVAEGQRMIKALFKAFRVSPFTPLKGLFIQAPIFIFFFLAITNMAQKVPSFKVGGAYWFTDLTTPDSMYIFPVLMALTFLLTVEFNMPVAGITTNVLRAFAVLTVPFTMNFPKALFCYWITSNFFTLVYGQVIKRPGVKKFLGIPSRPVAPPTAAPPVSQFPALKQAAVKPNPTSTVVEPSKPADRKIFSYSVASQRPKTLVKEVRGRKKNKKKGKS